LKWPDSMLQAQFLLMRLILLLGNVKRKMGKEVESSLFILSIRVKSELLTQIDGANSGDEEEGDTPKNIIVLGATNLPWDLDLAIIRRLDKRVCKIHSLNLRYTFTRCSCKRRAF